MLGEPVITPNLDSVSELKITTTAYDAEFGQASQAIISAQTKSGTNQVHGSGFWYRRDENGQARDPFAQANPIPGTGGRFVPVTLWNQFGGSAGANLDIYTGCRSDLDCAGGETCTARVCQRPRSTALHYPKRPRPASRRSRTCSRAPHDHS